MKNFLLFSLLLLGFSACTSQEATESTSSTTIYQRVDNETFQAKLADPDAVILDVRTPEETDRGIIEGAVLIDYRSADFKEKIAALDKEKTYLVYCQSGGRSAKASTMMQEMGFKEIYELKTGYGGL
jgi:rhodanese-related sulfurtransferase